VTSTRRPRPGISRTARCGRPCAAATWTKWPGDPRTGDCPPIRVTEAWSSDGPVWRQTGRASRLRRHGLLREPSGPGFARAQLGVLRDPPGEHVVLRVRLVLWGRGPGAGTGGALGILRRRKSCSLRGARTQWRLLLTIAVKMRLVTWPSTC
jgi:hypothetical protein